ncbi:MAG TPA: extracellular solute-binding protein [Virgibacillus sp.]|nr:extracellular solute-binding protein [Virgibacillus sp.]HLR68413.1 extracellular solute-binding protein [Virgibacillus sp.]
MKNHFLYALTMMFFVLVVVSACSGNSDSEDSNGEDGKEKIEFWTLALSDYDDFFEDLIDDFEEENPNVEVELLDVPADEIEQKLLSAVSAGESPDVVNLNPQFSYKLAGEGELLDMEDKVSDKEKDSYIDAAWEANQYKGETFGIPYTVSAELTVLNSDIYEEAGLDPNDSPETYEETKEDSETIKDETGKYGFYPAMDESKTIIYMQKFGADLTNEEGTKAAFNTQEGLNMFEYFTEMYEDDLIPDEALSRNDSQPQGVDRYQSGEVSIFPGSVFLRQYKANAPDIYDASKVSKPIEGESGEVSLSVHNLVVPKQSEHQDAAVDFSLFVSNAKNQLDWGKEAPVIPSSEEALEDDYFTEESDDPIDDARVKNAETVSSGDAVVLEPQLNNRKELVDSMHDWLEKSMRGDVTPQEALDGAEEEWNELLAE